MGDARVIVVLSAWSKAESGADASTLYCKSTVSKREEWKVKENMFIAQVML